MVWTGDQDNFKNKKKKKQIWAIGDSQANDISLKEIMYVTITWQIL